MADKTTTLKTKTNDNVYPNVIGDNRKNAFVDSSTITHHFYDQTHKVGFQIANETNIKIQNSLQKPAGLTKTKLVGVGTNGQENIEIGDNLTLANGKLSATGGSSGGEGGISVIELTDKNGTIASTQLSEINVNPQNFAFKYNGKILLFTSADSTTYKYCNNTISSSDNNVMTTSTLLTITLSTGAYIIAENVHNVVANSIHPANGGDLTNIQVGSKVYSIPSGGTNITFEKIKLNVPGVAEAKKGDIRRIDVEGRAGKKIITAYGKSYDKINRHWYIMNINISHSNDSRYGDTIYVFLICDSDYTGGDPSFIDTTELETVCIER